LSACLFLAGIGNSEPGHWQSIWGKKLPGAHWVEHRDWENPSLEEWMADLEKSVEAVPGDKLLVAHSLGCLLAAEWALGNNPRGVRGLFLVAVPDTEGLNFPPQARGFRSPLKYDLPLPAFMVASHNDPYAAFDYSHHLASHWKVPLEDLGEKGHINLKSNLGPWEEGRQRLEAFAKGLGMF
jgi:predicted alpha/beta hydrolase family esterase